MTQPARKPRQRPRHSGRATLELVRAGSSSTRDGVNPESPDTTYANARPDLTFQVEKFHEIARELPPLFERHYREIALDRDSIPLDPDWDYYLTASLQGIVHVMTARFGKTLAGYIFNLVGSHPHYRTTIFCKVDMFWLDPVYRGGSFSLRWFRANDVMLRELGVKKVGIATKNGYKGGRVGLIFKRLGYQPIETVWARTL